MEIVPLGDSALIVRVRDRFEDAPDEALNEVLRKFRRLQDGAIPCVIELVPAYTTVAVFFDPMVVASAGPKPDQALDWLTERVHAVVAAIGDRGIPASPTPATAPVKRKQTTGITTGALSSKRLSILIQSASKCASRR